MTEDNRDSVQIHNSRNVIGKNYNLVVNFFKDHLRTRRWIYTASAVTTVVLLLAIVTSTYILWPSTAAINHIAAAIPSSPASVGPDLQLTKLEVAKPSKIDADFLGPGAGQSYTQSNAEKVQRDVTNTDITVQNNGTQQSDITAAKIDVLYAEQMVNCGGAGPGEIEAGYDVRLPIPMPQRPFTMTRDMSFYVDPGKHDRFVINIGPQSVSASISIPYLIVAKVSLVHDNSPTNLDIGTIATVAPSGQGLQNVDTATDVSCNTQNAKLVNDLYKIPATRSDEVEHLHDIYATLLTPDPKPAQQQCVAWSNSPALPKMCATYTKQQLSLTISLASMPPLPTLAVVQLVDTDDPSKRYRMEISAFGDTFADAARETWTVVSLAEDTGVDIASTLYIIQNHAATFDPSNLQLIVAEPLPPSWLARSLDLSVHLDEVTGMDSTQTQYLASTVASTPRDGKLTVQRGS